MISVDLFFDLFIYIKIMPNKYPDIDIYICHLPIGIMDTLYAILK